MATAPAPSRSSTRKGADFTEIEAGFDLGHAPGDDAAPGRSTFPQIFVGDTYTGGCDDMMSLERDGKLDPMLAT